MQEARQDTGTGAGLQAHGKGSGSGKQRGSDGNQDPVPHPPFPPAAKVLSQLPVQTVHTANTILDELGVLQGLPQEALPELIAKTVVRRGKGGRQKQVDPLLDPRFAGLEPSKVARIMANREAAARSKLKAKLLKELQLQKLKGQPGSTSTVPAPKSQPAVKPPAGRSAARAAAAASQKENAARTAAAAAAAASSAAGAADVDALAALDCLAAIAAGEELLAPDSGTAAHRSAADPHGLQQLDAGAHRQRDSHRSSSSAAAAAKASQLCCDEQQLLTASSDELGELQDSDEADRAAHLRVMRRLQQIQLQRRGAGAAEASGGSSDSGKRKRASPDSALADAPAAPAAAVALTATAVDKHAHRSKRKRHMTSRAAEAAAAGLIPTAGLSPEEALAATAVHTAVLQMQQQQPKGLGRGPAAAAAAAACGGDNLSRQIHTEVQLLSSIDKDTVMEALERLFRLLASLLLSDDERADDALTLALQGLLGLLRSSSSSSSTCFGTGSSGSREGGGWSDLQLTALAVLDTLTRQAAVYRDCVVACGAPVVLVRLLEGAGSAAIQLAAIQALQALLQHGSVSTVEAVADAHGVEVLLLAVARGKAGSVLRAAAAACLCSMADVHPEYAEVAVAAAGVRHMAQPAGAASSSRT